MKLLTNIPFVFSPGIGVQVKSVEVLKEETTKGYSFNTKEDWSIDNLLTDFSRTDWSKYCLAHMFTHQVNTIFVSFLKASVHT